MLKQLSSTIKQGVNIGLVSLLTGFALPVMAQEVKINQAPIVMGYWENWGTYANFPIPNNAQNSTNPVLSGQLTGLTALAYAFLEVTSDGSIQFSDAWSDLNPNNPQDKNFCNLSPQSCPNFPKNAGLGNFSAFVNTSVAHHVISIGGAGHDQSWENAFNHPVQFAISLKQLVTTYKNIDWIDIDYEPVGGVPSQNILSLINLTSKIKAALPNIIISYTIPANADSIKNFGQANWQRLMNAVDYISVMGYDLHGAFDSSNPYTDLHSALYSSNNNFSTDSAIKALTSVGVSNNKIILGMPMYGRAVGGVQVSGLGQTFIESVKGDLDDANCSLNLHAGNVCSGMIQYKTLVDQKYTAVPAMINGKLSGVYAYDAKQKVFVSYDNTESAKAKAQYAVDNKLAGVMFWAIRFDKPVEDAQSILASVDKVYGITPHPVLPSDPKMKLQITNNDPNNPVTISLVTADKSGYYPFPQLSPKGQNGSDVIYNDVDSNIVKTLMTNNGIWVLLTPTKGAQLWCKGNLNFTTGPYHHIQVYYDTPIPNCLIN